MLKIIPNLTVWTEEPDPPEPERTDPFACDEFRMYEFKVRRCARGRAHDWTDCPYAHPGEKARRRDPRRFHYSGTPCPDFKRAGACERGDACEFAHGVFECWLHPARYRTQPCKDGTACRRKVCFFAHTPDQLRLLSPKSAAKLTAPDGYDGSPMRMKNNNSNSGIAMGSSPTSILSPTSYSEGSGAYSSPPVSPDGGLVVMMRRMNLCGGFGGSLPSMPMARRMVGFEEENNININDGFDGIDVGWISELVK